MEGNDKGEGDHSCSPDGCAGKGNGGMGHTRMSRQRSMPGREGGGGGLEGEMEEWMDGWMDRSGEERRENASMAPLDS